MDASHNGIRVPPLPAPSLLPLDNPWILLMSVAQFALADPLRPTLSLARDHIRDVPWSLHSMAHLALLRAMRKVGIAPFGDSLRFFLSGHLGNVCLQDVLADPLVTGPDGWIIEPLISLAPDQSPRVSIDAIRRNAMPCDLGPSFSSLRRGGFPSICRAALIQLHLTVQIRIRDAAPPALVVVSFHPASIRPGQNLFPPLFFVPYAGSRLLQVAPRSMLNQNHPFSNWLIDAASALANRCPHNLTRIQSAFDPPPRSLDDEIVAESVAKEVNAILHSLRTAPHRFPVPDSVFLKKKDFGW